MKAGIYVRLSKDPDGTSTACERQEKDARRFAKGKGWQVATVFVDNDVSAYDGRKIRPEFERLVAAVEAGEIEAVIVWKSDRLARQPRDLERFLDAAAATKVTVASVTEPEFSGPSGVFMLRQLVNFASHESGVKSERIRRKKLELAESGRWAGGPTPFGYRLRDGELVVDRVEAREIKAAAKALLAGQSLSSLSRDWTARKVGDRPRWNATRLKSVLTSARLVGDRVHLGQVVGKATWKPILDEDTHRALVALTEGRKRGKRAPRNENLLSGIAVCALCGRNLCGQASGYYTCSMGAAGCGGVSARIPYVDEVVVENFLALIRSKAFLAALDPPETPDTAPLVAELRAAERRLEEISAEWGAGRLTTAELTAARTPAMERVQEAREALAIATDTAIAQQLPDMREIAKRWEAADVGDRRRWIGALVERVEIKRSSLPSRRGFDRGRVMIRWRI
jgi:site-specific DNA recombinase